MKTVLFINGAYLDNVLTSFEDAKIDYSQFVDNIVETFNYKYVRTYYYHCPPFVSQDPTPEEERRYSSKMGFFKALRHIPNFEVYLGQLTFRGYTETQKPIFVRRLVDTRMCLDMLKLAHGSEIEKFVLITGDNNLVDTIDHVKNVTGVSVQLLFGPQSERHFVHRELVEICDNSTEIPHTIIDSARQ
jgi:uncharacterized LabA/DUF88 family protein